MSNENNLPILSSTRLPIEQKRNLKRMGEKARRVGKIALNTGIGILAVGSAAILGGPVANAIGMGVFCISEFNVLNNIVYKKQKNSMFTTKKDLKGEIALYQASNVSDSNKLRGLEAHEKGAVMGIEMLVGIQNYKQEFSDKRKKTDLSRNGENNVYPQVFKTVTHGINIKTIEALEQLGYLQIDDRFKRN